MMKIARQTEKYIAGNPVVKECLAMNMVNYSKLARRIGKELNIGHIPAIVVACRRYSNKFKKSREKTGFQLLKKSEKKIIISNKQAHITLKISEKHLPEVLGTLN